MSPPEDDEESSDIPTFEDLVEEVTGRAGEQPPGAEAGPGEDEGAEGATGPEDDAFDASAWEWGDESDDRSEEPASIEPMPETTAGGVDASSADGVPKAKLNALTELATNVSNILLLGPGGTAVENNLCATILAHDSGPEKSRVLVTTNQTPDDRLATLRGFGGGSFGDTTVISVGERVRSGSSNGTSFEINGETVTIETVRDRDDLTRLGLLINQSLSESVEHGTPTICFHSLTSLLGDGNLEKVFRFLHVLQGRASHADARAHYHLDPAGLAEDDVTILKQLFDLTVQFDSDGVVTFHT